MADFTTGRNTAGVKSVEALLEACATKKGRAELAETPCLASPREGQKRT
jgi:hypothetical protein